MTAFIENLDAIEACRTCGIYYMTTSNYLKPLFRQSPVENPEMMLIRLELAQWKLEVNENDGYPQYVCSTCVHEFQKVFKFRSSCSETQQQFRHFYQMRDENLANIKIKSEKLDVNEKEENIHDFIYVDDLSDTEYDGTTPFNVPHVPIKEEIIEAATVPNEPAEEPNQEIVLSEAAKNLIKHLMDTDTAAQTADALNLERNDETEEGNSISDELQVQESESESESESTQVECNVCQEICNSQDELKLHMQKIHDYRNMDCHICGKKFKNSPQSRLKFHLKWHSLNKHVKCTQCGFVCNSKESMQEHKRAAHTKLNCKICGKGILAKKMKNHLRQHEIQNKYPCDYCTAAFATENERETHIWEVHAVEDGETHTADTINSEAAHLPGNIAAEDQTNDLEQNNDGAVNDNIYDCELNEAEEELLCAHCDMKFTKQSDLELHVTQDHYSEQTLNASQQSSQSFSTNATMMEGGDTNYSQSYDGSLNQQVIQNNDDDDANEDNLHHQFAGLPFEQNIHDGDDDMEGVEEPQQSQHLSQTSSLYSHSDHDDHDQLVQQSSQTELSCEKCTQTFENNELLRMHILQKHLSEDKTSTEADAPATNSESDTSSTTQKKSKFSCQICAKTFDLKFSLNRHLKKHKTAPV